MIHSFVILKLILQINITIYYRNKCLEIAIEIET